MRTLIAILVLLNAPFVRAQKYSDKVKLLGQHGIPYFYNADVEANIEKWSLNDSNSTADVLGMSVVYHNAVEYARKTNGLPWFVKFIPAANTGFDNGFMGKDGSKGVWPLSFAIAKKYGLKVNSYLDERRNIETSADAACRYLADLNYIYRDWLKTITAFRIGAIRLNQVIRLAGNSLDFNEIYQFLTPEEREPIVQFYAAVTVMYFRHDFKIDETEFAAPDADTVYTAIPLKYDFLKEKLNIEPQVMRTLNPHFIADLVPWFGNTTTFRIPASLKEAYDLKRDSFKILMNQPDRILILTEDTVVEVRNGITYISVKQNENPDSAGDIVEPDKDTASRIWVWYTVKTGDGFYTLSDIFDCSIEEMKEWNQITGNTLIANNIIRFYVDGSKADHYKKLNSLSHQQKRNIALSD